MNKHIGSSFDDFLEEEGLLAETESVAIKRLLAFQISQLMKSKKCRGKPCVCPSTKNRKRAYVRKQCV